MSANQTDTGPEAEKGQASDPIDAAIRAGLMALPLWPETGRILGMGRNSTYEAAKRGDIPVTRIGGAWKVPIPRLKKLLGYE